MRKARFTGHPIIAVLKSVEAGGTVKDVCREAGISETRYDNRKAKYGAMEVCDIRKIKRAGRGEPPSEADVCQPQC